MQTSALKEGIQHMTMLSPPGSASSSIMDQNRSAAGSSSRREAQFSGQTSSSQYPPTSAAYNTFPPTSGTAVGAPEPSPPPSLLGQAARDQASSFTSTWITPASTEDLAGDDDDNYADTDFVFENGRRYHAPASGRVVYPLPNDESEQERDDMKHKLALWMMHEKLLYSPVEESLEQGGMVLDLGMWPPSSGAFLLTTLHPLPVDMKFLFFFFKSPEETASCSFLAPYLLRQITRLQHLADLWTLSPHGARAWALGELS